MQFIDHLIEATLYGSALILAVSFARYSWQRVTANRTPVLSTAQSEPAAPAQPKVEISDVVVPFIRPVRNYSDLALIRLAKTLAKRGRYSKSALKWSYDRKLSKPVRAELLRLAQSAA